MKSASLLLCLAALPVLAQDAPAKLDWLSDLDAACAKAAKEGKLVFLRQIVCDCGGKDCLYRDVATAPWYLGAPAIRELVDESFVRVVVHVAPAKKDEGLIDAGFPPSGDGLQLRTLMLTPAYSVIHRLDLCPYSGDVKSEISFAVKAARECFDAHGTAKPGHERTFIELHREHHAKPETWHERGAGGCGAECGCKPLDDSRSLSKNPWDGYRRGILWHTDMAETKELAAKSKRLILYYQIVGELSKEGC